MFSEEAGTKKPTVSQQKGFMKHRPTESSILNALEALAASFPWDTVDIWIRREPKGEIAFTAYVEANIKLGFKCIFGHGRTAMDAVNAALNEPEARNREPEMQRAKAIRELEQKIEQLKAVEIGLPPYRPGYHLAEGPSETPTTTDVQCESV